jgi:hypothetical protein
MRTSGTPTYRRRLCRGNDVILRKVGNSARDAAEAALPVLAVVWK